MTDQDRKAIQRAAFWGAFISMLIFQIVMVLGRIAAQHFWPHK